MAPIDAHGVDVLWAAGAYNVVPALNYWRELDFADLNVFRVAVHCGVAAVWTETVFGRGEWKKPILLAKAMHASTAVQITDRWVVEDLFVQITEAKGKGTISIAAE